MRLDHKLTNLVDKQRDNFNPWSVGNMAQQVLKDLNGY